MELDITSSESAHIAAMASWEQEISNGLTLTTSAALEFATSDSTLHAQTWIYFLNYNPFHPGSRLQSNGAGSVELDSRSITPHVLVELRWHVSDHFGVGLDAGMGYTFERYDAFNFYSPTNQVFRGVDVIEGITYTDSYHAFRWLAGASVSYALSDKWRLSLGYQFLFKGAITLENTVLDDEGDQYIYFLPLRERKSQRMTLASGHFE